MRVLVIALQVGPSSSRGHLNPLAGVVQWLVADGHEVGWLPLPSAMGEADLAQVVGLGARPIAPPPLLEGTIRPGHELARMATDPARIWEIYQSILLAPVEPLLAGAAEQIAAFGADVALVDTMSYTGILACEQVGLPWVGVCAGLKLLHPPGFSDAYQGDMSRLTEPRAELFARHGMSPDFRLFECPSPLANVVFATEALVGSTNPPAGTRLVGPSITPRPRGDEPAFSFDRLPTDRPLVYAAFGSVHTRLELADVTGALIEATEQLGTTLLLSSEALTGRELPAHVLTVPYAPQLAVLERADAFLTHGGANSVMEAMYCGVPSLVVPLSSDQPLQAMFVERSGAGIALSRDDVNTKSVREALSLLLDPGGVARKAARRIQDSYRDNDGARVTAQLLADVLVST